MSGVTQRVEVQIGGPMGLAYLTLPCHRSQVRLRWAEGELVGRRTCPICHQRYRVEVATDGETATATPEAS